MHFSGGQSMTIKEYVITGYKCLDRGIPIVTPAKLTSVQPLNEVWHKSLRSGCQRINQHWEPLTTSVAIDRHLLEKIPNSSDAMMRYFVMTFIQSSDLRIARPDVMGKILALLPGGYMGRDS
uniref:Uncharacterized protein n=1 Tax=Cacopsylla melanoneura TaxID=428564 RepID=A0A8D8YXQ5_9HEMI